MASLALLIPLISLVLQPSKNANIIEWLGILNYSDSEKVSIVFAVFMIVIGLKGLFVNRFTFFTSAYIKISFQNLLFKKYLEKDFISHLSSTI